MVVLFPVTDAQAKSSSASNVTTYNPVYETCPASDNLIRRTGTPQAGNQTLNTDEVEYINSRQKIVQTSLRSWLGDSLSTVYSGNFDALSATDMPNFGIAMSGGNLRAALFNAAALNAFDDRNETSVARGLGGLLQSSTYMTALSGGSYVSTSLIFNEFPTLPNLVFGNETAGIPGWQLVEDMFEPGPSGAYEDTFIGHLMDDLGDKRFAGDFPVTFCDLWGRALSYHFMPGTAGTASFASNTTVGNHAAAISYSSMTQLESWKTHALPFPVVLINVNSPNAPGVPFGDTGAVPLTTVVYELTPFEFGSYEPQLAAFVSLSYLGSTFSDGMQEKCVNSFDNAGLMIGTSSCDFHIYNYTHNPIWNEEFVPLIDIIDGSYGKLQPGQEMDVMSVANPFYKMNVGTYQDWNETALSLLDGSLDVENDPILPLLVKKRNVDAIVILDSSGETAYDKPSGLSLMATQEKAAILPSGTINFPTPFPASTNEFMSLGLNERPVFFGCDGANNTNDDYPVFVYIPNDDPTGMTNISTATLQISVANQTDIFDNGYLLATRGYAGINNTNLEQHDAEWSTCVACALFERMRVRQGAARTSACNTCFSRYCYIGQNMSSAPYSSTLSSSYSSPTSSSASSDLSVHDSSDAVSSASPSSSSSPADYDALVRNEYIIMGLLVGIVVLLLAIGGMVIRRAKAARSGYKVVGGAY
ncbi:uncharacterized protein FIBRA_03507 [Fibroporia radiculosa]|uniref:Lysophospholipase n=1 Tax=Fibroporia radiculosa TaxID=599839 RepID=J4H2F9_9APHY|nr:uncharacterized protein FIBRA_03507 [Fibroporia radiculosa]CCM01454.1 predicted protein [Fibroporia radiculosa]